VGRVSGAPQTPPEDLTAVEGGDKALRDQDFSLGVVNGHDRDAAGHILVLVRWVSGDGVRLAVLDEGEGPAVLLLHGFPDSSQGWRYQVPALRAAGFHVIAPDLRGFGDSDKPEGVSEYALSRSIGDMLALLDALDVERAHVVGHDWGAGLAWTLAAFAPARVDRLAVLSVGHPNAYREPSLEQRQKGWYQLLFQFEGVAEALLSQNDWKLFRELLTGALDRDRFLEDLAQPGALTAGLGWYRANSDPRHELEPRQEFPSVAAPTLALWSSGDAYLTEEPVLESAQYVTGPWRYERIDGAGHWLQVDAPEAVNRLLLDFLA
jgi:pimeloyl-ACP methyl ester carboxylesterase